MDYVRVNKFEVNCFSVFIMGNGFNCVVGILFGDVFVVNIGVCNYWFYNFI